MNDAQKEWYRQRIEAIHEVVSAYEVLRSGGINLIQHTDDTEEQISCPFHGKDTKPSARVYPAEGDSPSHVWCFVCQEKHWDAIGLWRKFNNDASFTAAVSGLERAYGLQTPDVPKGSDIQTHVDTTLEDRFKRHYIATENMLKASRSDYQLRSDLSGFLAASSALDQIRFRSKTSALTYEQATGLLTDLRSRIEAKAVTERPL